jgi:exonuclease III
MAGITRYLTILALNVNGLHSPMKRHQLAIWYSKKDPKIYCLDKIHLMDRNKYCPRMKGWKIYQANFLLKQAGVPILIYSRLQT